jgi:Flp pilus assembly protein TadG
LSPTPRRLASVEGGPAAAEFAIIVPVLFPLQFATFEPARLLGFNAPQ